jgi:AcrR family transcriptional regulator
MGRPARIFPADLIAAASRIAARLGAARATIAAIAKEAKAPVGSMYHRYPSRGALLAEVWIAAAERFGTQFSAVLTAARDADALIEAALITPRFAREDPAAGVVLFAHRRDDYLDEAPEESRTRAAKLVSALQKELAGAAKRLLPGDPRGRERLAVALIGIPYGTVRVFLPQAMPPLEIDAVIAAAARAALSH